MKSYTEHLWFNTSKRIEFINITGKIEQLVKKSGIKEGIVLVNAMHITASVFINDNESGLHNDFDVWLEKLAPHAVRIALTNQSNDDERTKAERLGVDRYIVKASTIPSEVVSMVGEEIAKHRSIK